MATGPTETPSLTDWRKTGDVDGPFPGGFFENPDSGKENYVSSLPTGDNVNNAVAASRLFNEMGVPAPDAMRVDTPSGRPALAQELVPGADPDIDSKMLDDPNFKSKLQSQFAPYAFMGMHDFEDGSIVADGDGMPVPTNLRSTMKYDSFGAPKGAGFGPEPAEILSLRDPKFSPRGAELFGDMSEEDVRNSIEGSVARLDPSKIGDIMSETGMESALGDTLNTRRQRMLSDYEVDDPYVEPEPELDMETMQGPNMANSLDAPWAQSGNELNEPSGLGNPVGGDFGEEGPGDEEFGPEEMGEGEDYLSEQGEIPQEEDLGGPGPPTLERFKKEFGKTKAMSPGQRMRSRKKRAEDTIVNLKQSLATVRPGDTGAITRLISTIKNFRNLYKDDPAISTTFDELLAEAYRIDMDNRSW